MYLYLQNVEKELACIKVLAKITQNAVNEYLLYDTYIIDKNIIVPVHPPKDKNETNKNENNKSDPKKIENNKNTDPSENNNNNDNKDNNDKNKELGTLYIVIISVGSGILLIIIILLITFCCFNQRNKNLMKKVQGNDHRNNLLIV